MKWFCLDFYSFENYSYLENLPLVNIEWRFYPILFPWWLSSYIFLLQMSLFSPMMKRKSEKNQSFNYFVRILLKFEEKNLGIHKLSWLLITWILKKWNSIQTLVENIPEIKLRNLTGTCGAKPIKNYIQKLELSLPWTNLFVIQIIA